LQVTSAILIIILSVVALLFVALLRMGKLARIKVSLKSVPVTFTFEAGADSKLGEIPPGEDELKDTAPVGKERRQGRSSGLPEPAGHA
jgi:hypothetical protein